MADSWKDISCLEMPQCDSIPQPYPWQILGKIEIPGAAKKLTFAVIEDPKSVSILVSVKLTNNHIRVLEDEPQVPVMNIIKQGTALATTFFCS